MEVKAGKTPRGASLRMAAGLDASETDGRTGGSADLEETLPAG